MATPIGNLADVTLRALDVLRGVDAIAAEDTRVTARLLARHGIDKRMIAVHEHNEQRAAAQIVARLAAGRSIALVTDAGTPAISDPGARVVAAARSAGYRVSPVPGACAAIAALSASGIAGSRFLFFGFLPERAGARREALTALADLPWSVVFYEAPHRIEAALADMRAAFGDGRRVVIARELTKVFESIHACTLAEAGAWLAGDRDRGRGEFVVIVEAADERRAATPGEARRVLDVLLGELPLKQAVALAARITGARRNDLYGMALAARRGG